MTEPNWDRLKELGDEVTSLQDSGEWSREQFERLMPEAEKAAGGHDEFVEFMINAADPAWLEN